MPAAARMLDATAHPGFLSFTGAVPTVLIGGMPAAVTGTLHICTMPPTAGPHPPSPVAGGSATVLISGRPAARMGDKAGCGAVIVSGAPTVQIGG
jgi:uncharacterized Zn-binding protein involved in type VI secretion